MSDVTQILGADAQPHWQNRAHFFAAAAEAMRRILVDRARRKRALRHGAGAEHVELDGLAEKEAGNQHGNQGWDSPGGD